MNIQCVFVVTFAAPGTFSQAATFALQNAFFLEFSCSWTYCIMCSWSIWSMDCPAQSAAAGTRVMQRTGKICIRKPSPTCILTIYPCRTICKQVTGFCFFFRLPFPLSISIFQAQFGVGLLISMVELVRRINMDFISSGRRNVNLFVFFFCFFP
jgi:hypothetical protein